jgi:hypothetical protein
MIVIRTCARRHVLFFTVCISLALVTASCTSPHTGTSTTHAPNSNSTGTKNSTVFEHYPTPYAPSYSTIYGLVQDSTFVVLGTLQPGGAGKNQNGELVTVCPIAIQQDFGTTPPISLNVSQAEVTAANLAVGSTYAFFWGADPIDKTACIVGGVRGVMSYDTRTSTLTRLDDAKGSEIPRTQSLKQFSSSIRAAYSRIGHQPNRNQPPICSSSATRLPSG